MHVNSFFPHLFESWDEFWNICNLSLALNGIEVVRFAYAYLPFEMYALHNLSVIIMKKRAGQSEIKSGRGRGGLLSASEKKWGKSTESDGMPGILYNSREAFDSWSAEGTILTYHISSSCRFQFKFMCMPVAHSFLWFIFSIFDECVCSGITWFSVSFILAFRFFHLFS